MTVAEAPVKAPDETLCPDCPWCHPEVVGAAVLDLFARAEKLRAITLPGLRISRAGERSSNPGGLWLADNGGFGESTFYGSVRPDGATRLTAAFRGLPRDEQVRLAGRLRRLAAFGPLELARIGQETGVCCYCAAELSDPVSLALGYGPICAGHHGLPHSAASAGVERVKAPASRKGRSRGEPSAPRASLRERLGVAEPPVQAVEDKAAALREWLS